MNPGLFNTVWQQIAVRIDNATGQLSDALMTWTGPRFKYWVMAYLLSMLAIALLSPNENAFSRFFRQLYLAGILYTLISVQPVFQTYVVGAAQGFVDGIAAAISTIFGGGGKVGAGAFDIIVVKVFAVGVKVFTTLNWYTPKSWFLALCVALYWVIAIPAVVVIFITYLLSIIASHFLLAFGPLFIALYFFSFTRTFFDGWLRAIVAGILTQIFTIAWLSLFVASLTGMLATLTGTSGADDPMTQVFALFLAAGLVAIFATMTAFSALAAMRIANGVHAQVQTGFRGPPSPAPPVTNGGGGGSGSGGSGGGGGGGNGGGGSGGGGGSPSSSISGPHPVYAFTRTVGAAPLARGLFC